MNRQHRQKILSPRSYDCYRNRLLYLSLAQSKWHYYYVNNLTARCAKFQLHRTKNYRIQIPIIFPQEHTSRYYKILSVAQGKNSEGCLEQKNCKLSYLLWYQQLITMSSVNGLFKVHLLTDTYTFLQSLLLFCNNSWHS